jgi:pantoate--beta-alanine ligase
VREPDGLALSSRNQYLETDQRRHAVVLHEALREAGRLAAGGERDPAVLRRAMLDRIQATPGAAVDYAELVNPDTLQPVTTLAGDVLAAVAVKFGSTRLIDNLVIRVLSPLPEGRGAFDAPWQTRSSGPKPV